MTKTHCATIVFCLILTLFASCTKTNSNTEFDFLPEIIDGKGTLVIEGGGDNIAPIFDTIIKYAGGNSAKILVVPFASSIPEYRGVQESGRFRELGCLQVDFVLCPKDSVDAPQTLAKLHGVTGIFFSGGDQLTLCSYLEGTEFLKRVRDIYKNGGVVSGTSAGAAIMSRIMLTGESLSDTAKTPKFNYFQPKDVVTAQGFGFLENIIIDQHFVARKRSVRLLNVLIDNPHMRGIGIDEETAIVIKPDNTLEVIGDGKVILYEPYRVNTNKKETTSTSGISYKMTIMSRGDRYKL